MIKILLWHWITFEGTLDIIWTFEYKRNWVHDIVVWFCITKSIHYYYYYSSPPEMAFLCWIYKPPRIIGEAVLRSHTFFLQKGNKRWNDLPAFFPFHPSRLDLELALLYRGNRVLFLRSQHSLYSISNFVLLSWRRGKRHPGMVLMRGWLPLRTSAGALPLIPWE